MSHWSLSTIPRRRAPRCRRGFSLIEVALAMAVTTLVAAAALPSVIGSVRQDAAQRTARDMQAILDAAKAFYAAQPVGSQRWPTGLNELKTAGFLPSWVQNSPFGTPYSGVPTGSNFGVQVTVPNDVAASVARLLPLASTTLSGGQTQVSAQVPTPGLSADLSNGDFLRKPGTNVPNNAMTGPLAILDSGGNQIAWINTAGQAYFGGNVGIGTTAPQDKLHVAGNIRTDSSSGSSGLDMYTGGTNRVTAYNQGGAFRVDTAGVNRLTINTVGNVGIGTSNPSSRMTVVGGYASTGLQPWTGGLNISANGSSPDAAQVWWGDNTGWRLNFGTRDSAGNFVTRMSLYDTGGVDVVNNINANIFYDRYNTGYYVQPRGWSNFWGICLGGVCRNSWPAGASGWSGTMQAVVQCGFPQWQWAWAYVYVSNGVITGYTLQNNDFCVW